MFYQLVNLGAISALGAGRYAHLAKASSGAPGLAPESTPNANKPTFTGRVREQLTEIPSSLEHIRSANTQLLFTAVEQIRDSIEAAQSRFGSDRIAIVLGSSTSGIASGENAIALRRRTGSLPESYTYLQQEMGAVSQSVAEYLGITGPAYTVSTACSSSAKVFQSARSLLRLGLADAVITGGADSLCNMTLEGFAALDLVSAKPTNPFSANRDGISIGEGACVMLMTRDQGGIQLLGVGESSDAYHMSTPEPSGRGAEAAMRKALTDANVATEEVDYLNLHGTGTLANDLMEAKAVRSVFGENGPFASSSKPLMGHTLGASGALEAGLCWLALDEFLRSGSLPLPVHRYDGVYDEAVPRLRLVADPVSLTPRKRATCMTNSFGFGGSNCSILLGAQR